MPNPLTFTPLRWVIVPQPNSASDDRAPVFFSTERAAKEWQAKNDAGWYRRVLPLLLIAEVPKAHRSHIRLCEYLPIAQMGQVADVSIGNMIGDALRHADYEITGCLWDDWQFDAVQNRVRFREGHQFHLRQYQSIAASIMAAAQDLEVELYSFHPTLNSAGAIRFWQSWQVQAYLRRFMFALIDSGVYGIPTFAQVDGYKHLYAAEKAIWSYTQRIAPENLIDAGTTASAGALRTEQAEAILSREQEVDVPTAALCLGLTEGQVRRLARDGVLSVTKDTRPIRVSSRSVRKYRNPHSAQ